MKYKKLDINEKIIGEGFIIYDWQEDEDNITIFTKSTVHEDICPCCGKKVTQLHNTYHRKLQTTPIRGKTTYFDVNAYKFKCTNDECDRKVVTQNLPFASPSQHRTDDLNCLILAMSMFVSNEGTSKILDLLGIKASNSAIDRLLAKITIEDDPDIEAIGIDDVAIRKGQTYATAIYDLDDHHMIALLEGRDKETVVKWLKGHKKIRVVARDRASAYAAAIREILPECTQVADRFHLLQNLIDKMKEIFKDEIPYELFIRDGEILNEAPDKVKVLKVSPDDESLKKLDYDNSDPVDGDGNIIEFDKRVAYAAGKNDMKVEERRKKNKN